MSQSPPLTIWEKATSASLGALVTSIIVTPMDVVKFRLQAQDASTSTFIRSTGATTFFTKAVELSTVSKQYRSFVKMNVIHDHGLEPFELAARVDRICHIRDLSSNENLAQSPQASKRLRGTWHGLRHIAAQEGITQLWRGLSPTLAMSVPATVMYYVAYDSGRNYLMSDNMNMAVASLVAGSTARGSYNRCVSYFLALAATVISPLEMIRTRVQSTENVRLGDVFDDVRLMVRERGPSSLWRGLTATLWRDVPFSGIYWSCYESMNAWLTEKLPHEHSYTQFFISFVAGASSGMLAAAVTTPFDVAKTMRQLSPLDAAKALSVPYNEVPTSTLGLLRQLWRIDGVAGLSRGLSARVSKVAPACAIMISCYESGKRYFLSKRNNQTINM